jgi:hypothetical protein
VQSMWIGVGMAAVALVFLLVRGPRRAVVAAKANTDAELELAATG